MPLGHIISERLAGAAPQARSPAKRGHHLPSDAWERVLAALREPACPICLSLDGRERQWLESFLDEGYQTMRLLQQVARGPGLCSRHATLIDTFEARSATIAHVHVAVITNVLDRLRAVAEADRRAAEVQALCQLCEHQEDAARSEAHLLGEILRHRGSNDYGSPAMLCSAHLGLIAGELDATALSAISSRHSEYLDGLDASACRSGELADLLVRLIGEPPDSSWTVAPSNTRPLGGADPWASIRDPVARFRGRISDESECPLCAEMSHLQDTWLNWLRNHDSADNHEDVLPACPRHVWLAFRTAGPAVQQRLIQAIVHRERMRLKHVRRLWADEPAAVARWSTSGLSSFLRAPPRSIRAQLARPAPCALCEHLQTVCRRTIVLLDILLGEAATRKAIERGFGLCARHALPAFAMLGRDSRRFLAGVLRVKFAVMRWELNETLRKSAWNARPEQEGDDPTAWRRAIALISGHMT